MVEMRLVKVVIAAILLSLLIYYLPTILLEKGVTVRMLEEARGNVSVTLHENQTTLSEEMIQKAYSTTKMEKIEDMIDRLRESLNTYFMGNLFISILTALTISIIVKRNYLEKE
ncbi:MAG: hypothetical protein QXU63_07915 [Nitrososphaerota archaeon]